MTFVNVKTRPVNGHFNNFVSDFFAPLPSIKSDLSQGNFAGHVPVNVKETESGYQLEVVAPGFAKEEFQISVEQNLLTIAAEKKSENDVKEQKTLRSEYQFKPFRRSFSLEKNIDTDAISAGFVNGVLVLNLPKKAEVKTVKNITIA